MMLARFSLDCLGGAGHVCTAPEKLQYRLKTHSAVPLGSIEATAAASRWHWSSVAGARGGTNRLDSAASGQGAGRASARPDRVSEHCEGALGAVCDYGRSHSEL